MADDLDLAQIVRGQIDTILAALDPPSPRTGPYVTATPPAPCADGVLHVHLVATDGTKTFTVQVAPEWCAAALVMRWDASLSPPLRTAHLVGLGVEGQPVEVVDLWRAE